MKRLSNRLDGLSGSATMAVDEAATALIAAGQEVILLNSGEAEYPTPQWATDAAIAACQDPRNNRYSGTAGLPLLREALAEGFEQRGMPLPAGQIIITSGAKHGIYAALCALLDPGDEVLLPTPCWTTFPASVLLAGGVPVPVFSEFARDFEVTVDQLEAARSPRTRVIILVSPGNPTGTVYRKAALRAITEWAIARGIWILFDEVYREFVYDGVEMLSPISVVPEAADQCLIVGSAGKAYCMTGWRIGWVAGPRDLIQAMKRFQSHSMSHVPNVSQEAALGAMRHAKSFSPGLRAELEARRLVMKDGLDRIKGMYANTPQGGFYFFVNVEEVLATAGVDSTAQLAEVILQRGHVAVVPGEAFGAPGYLRLSFTLAPSTISEGLDRISGIVG